jgi:TP901-1 family phage major tail protein
MVAQKGKDLLLKLDSGSGGAFVTVAVLRSKRIAFNSETVDITDADSAGRWRELLAGAGVQRAAISGSGIFKDAASDAAIRSRFFAGDIANWQLAVPDFGIVSGPFQIT